MLLVRRNQQKTSYKKQIINLDFKQHFLLYYTWYIFYTLQQNACYFHDESQVKSL